MYSSVPIAGFGLVACTRAPLVPALPKADTVTA